MIRPMNIEEVEEVAGIWLETSIRCHDFIPRDFWRSKKSDMIDAYLPGAENWVYELQGRIVGFYSLVDDILAALFVLPGFQGREIGSRLLDHAKTERKRLALTVYAENNKARRFYERRGFAVAGSQNDLHTGHMEYFMEYEAGK